ncbi:hypothetical protein CRN77_10800 [Proteus vulgaris]|nr:hypothetical protein CRN77_10800 [Proteus vulgaris]
MTGILLMPIFHISHFHFIFRTSILFIYKSNYEAMILWADNLRSISILAVVLLHVSSGFVGDISISSDLYGSKSWWAGNIYESISRWCVPSFVMISGYFLLNKKEDNLTFFHKRVKRILIPLIFWSVFFSFWMVLRYFVKGELPDVLPALIKNWLLGQPYYHLWFLFMIPFLYLVTPILRVAFSNSSKGVLFSFIVLCFSLSMLTVIFYYIASLLNMGSKVTLFTNNFLMFLGYFCLGGYICKYNIELKLVNSLLIFLLSVMATAIGSYFFTYEYFYSYLSITTVFSSISIFFLIKQSLNRKSFIGYFSGLSFGIYLIHPVFIDIISFLGKGLIQGKINAFIYIPLATICVYLLSYLVALFMSKSRILNKCI